MKGRKNAATLEKKVAYSSNKNAPKPQQSVAESF